MPYKVKIDTDKSQFFSSKSLQKDISVGSEMMHNVMNNIFKQAFRQMNL
jgi:hypothetical protein